MTAGASNAMGGLQSNLTVSNYQQHVIPQQAAFNVQQQATSQYDQHNLQQQQMQQHQVKRE